MIQTDYLVIGSGIAGLFFALKAAAKGTVTIVTKKADTDSNTNYAQGGIAGVFDSDDSPGQHIQDTISAGTGLSHPEAVRAMAEEGPGLIRELEALGAGFSRGPDGAFDLGKEGGHSRRRIVHAMDFTGREIERALVAAVRGSPKVFILEDHTAVDLILGKPGGSCQGAYVLDNRSGEVKTLAAGSVALAAGGCGQVYLHTTNPGIATGDGLAMACRAGAVMANLEFIQFHPTSLYQAVMANQERSFLVSEAVRGEGGVLRDRSGRAFMTGYDARADLAPRDVTARAIDSEMKMSGEPCVFLDISAIGLEKFEQRFPNIWQGCKARGVDITSRLLPVVPAAHYVCGGVQTDLDGRTSIEGLYAIGETACTGVHGANRLASNSLLEALVFANRAAKAAGGGAPSQGVMEWNYVGSVPSREKVIVSHNRLSIRSMMSTYVGIVRSDQRLSWARRRITDLAEEIRDYYWRYRVAEELVELRSIQAAAEMIIDCAISRQESRGLHYNQDHPATDDARFKRDTLIQWGRLIN